MKFGEAIEMLANGSRMTRKGWNGKGMFIYLVKGRIIFEKDWTGAAECLTEMTFGGKKEKVAKLNNHIDMKCADGSICVGWLASQTDMLADDWVEVL